MYMYMYRRNAARVTFTKIHKIQRLLNVMKYSTFGLNIRKRWLICKNKIFETKVFFVKMFDYTMYMYMYMYM